MFPLALKTLSEGTLAAQIHNGEQVAGIGMLCFYAYTLQTDSLGLWPCPTSFLTRNTAILQLLHFASSQGNLWGQQMHPSRKSHCRSPSLLRCSRSPSPAPFSQSPVHMGACACNVPRDYNIIVYYKFLQYRYRVQQNRNITVISQYRPALLVGCIVPERALLLLCW